MRDALGCSAETVEVPTVHDIGTLCRHVGAGAPWSLLAADQVARSIVKWPTADTGRRWR
jgi:hypothetical protein